MSSGLGFLGLEKTSFFSNAFPNYRGFTASAFFDLVGFIGLFFL
ncbi:hypothetical protein [Helicobacter phage Pt4497U]|nr:hypothetical protein [Helicobacter phage Pt4497U]